MDPNTRALMMGAAGAAGGEKVYVEDVFSTWLYTGNGSTRTITNGIDLSGKGGLVWIKARNIAVPHALFDTQRGATYMLQSQSAAAQALWSDSLTSYGSTGFSLGADTNAQNVNFNNDTYASWTFRKAAKFFDIVTWTGDGTANRRISHSLGSVPGCIVVKQTSANGGNAYPADWFVWHRTYAESYNYQKLNATNAVIGSGGSYPFPFGSLPTSTTFGVQSAAESYGRTNATGETYVAYLFAHDAGGFGDSGNDSVVKCGSYTGTGTPGLAVTLGFEPQWVMIKSASSSSYTSWFIFDNMRGMAVGNGDPYLYANASSIEQGPEADYIDPTATGFTLKNTSNVINESGVNYIYIAIRRGPMKTPTDATKVFSANTGSASKLTTNFVVDAQLFAYRLSDNRDSTFVSRLTGVSTSSTPMARGLVTSSTAAESTSNQTIFNTLNWDNIGFDPSPQLPNIGIYWSFRRAPGFFDVVAYTGDSAKGRSISHNLGVAPEMIIAKRRTGGNIQWGVYHFKAISGTGPGSLHLDAVNSASAGDLPYLWGNETTVIAPTSTVFTVNAFGDYTNGSGNTYIAYLFASCPGVSKVGSYTGTGTTLNIDCGFTNGARFVMIKRTDSTGDWYVWDTARGIISANDPYLLLNSAAAEVTSTDYIDPLSSGFQISSTAPAAINNNGGSFIFFAVA